MTCIRYLESASTDIYVFSIRRVYICILSCGNVLFSFDEYVFTLQIAATIHHLNLETDLFVPNIYQNLVNIDNKDFS